MQQKGSLAGSKNEPFVITDSRDDKKYKAIKIGSQTWLAENLNYEAEGSKCYDDSPANCKKYGRLYDWEVAMKACPSGWHLPSNEEWETLKAAVGDASVNIFIRITSGYTPVGEGKKLKATNGWNDYKEKSGNGSDAFGFSALPGGHSDSDGKFSLVGDGSFWWSASEHPKGTYWWTISSYSDEFSYFAYYKSSLHSIRCVQN
ncbi:MAG: fibrobacter succinogenes major paralogous domain-containing protein [Fibromonadales bacterium]|nr:fibrobacter succinogenes major paralogous domain-containing protein [Fibromonadales bacterium]